MIKIRLESNGEDQTVDMYFARIDECYDTAERVHLKDGHGGPDKMADGSADVKSRLFSSMTISSEDGKCLGESVSDISCPMFRGHM